MDKAAVRKRARFSKLTPETFGPFKGANGHGKITGPCGDTMEFWLFIKGGAIVIATFTTDGCDHSIRCGAGAAALIREMSLEEALKVSQADVLEIADDIPSESRHCGLLAANTVKAAIQNYHSQGRIGWLRRIFQR